MTDDRNAAARRPGTSPARWIGARVGLAIALVDTLTMRALGITSR
jgi:hypothetical protein